jgi:hypothetical protein
VLKDWRKLWDTHWHLENADLVKMMKARGTKIVEDKANGNKFFIRDISPTSAKTAKHVYDPVIDDIRLLSKKEIDTAPNIYTATHRYLLLFASRPLLMSLRIMALLDAPFVLQYSRALPTTRVDH